MFVVPALAGSALPPKGGTTSKVRCSGNRGPNFMPPASPSPGQCAELACLLEVTARKPGNVHPWASFEDVSFLHFVQCAVAIGPILEHAPEKGVGRTVLACVSRCQELVRTNTNLGIVLLLAPLAAVPQGIPLRKGIQSVLSGLTLADSQDVYKAIRLARPGGLGTVREQDVAVEPTLDLQSVMRLAADRDLVARQYANGFQEIFDLGVPALAAAQQSGLNWEHAIIRCHLELMARVPDTLIARKLGVAEAAESARRAAEVLAVGWPRGERSQQLFAQLDTWLRTPGHPRNPGTTADLVTASLFVALRDGTMVLGG